VKIRIIIIKRFPLFSKKLKKKILKKIKNCNSRFFNGFVALKGKTENRGE